MILELLFGCLALHSPKGSDTDIVSYNSTNNTVVTLRNLNHFRPTYMYYLFSNVLLLIAYDYYWPNNGLFTIASPLFLFLWLVKFS